ncbi:MAG: tRNA lysidine(34) synthetase TilS [Kiloniellales bacterium]
MAAVGPFESAPRIAVGVSGGADSMALCLLLKNWTETARGELVALTVDHGLRPDSHAEARRVGRWLARWGVTHRVLRWTGPKPRHGIQAAARAARYRLMTDWCHTAGFLHLALAHHRDDQAETVLLRLAGGSGLDGLAGMAAVSELAALHLIRPLLDIPKAGLIATLSAFGQDWIEDPSNRDPRHQRGRLRAAWPVLEREGLTAARLAATAAKLGLARAALETETAALLAAAAIHPEGYVRLDWQALMRAPAALARRALARCLMTVGGARYPPRSQRLERLFLALVADPAGAGRTLGGCRVLARDGRLLLCREASAARERVPLSDRRSVLWDGRFLVPPARAFGLPAGGVTVARLGGAGWRALEAAEPALGQRLVPAAVRPSLPALIDRDGILAVPHLGYTRRDATAYTAADIRFAPRNPLAPAAFVVAPERFDIIF